MLSVVGSSCDEDLQAGRSPNSGDVVETDGSVSSSKCVGKKAARYIDTIKGPKDVQNAVHDNEHVNVLIKIEIVVTDMPRGLIFNVFDNNSINHVDAEVLNSDPRKIAENDQGKLFNIDLMKSNMDIEQASHCGTSESAAHRSATSHVAVDNVEVSREGTEPDSVGARLVVTQGWSRDAEASREVTQDHAGTDKDIDSSHASDAVIGALGVGALVIRSTESGCNHVEIESGFAFQQGHIHSLQYIYIYIYMQVILIVCTVITLSK